jgi:penicillin-insensitive murein endopeptidase
VHPLQRRSGTDRKSLRLNLRPWVLLFTLAGAGCSGPLATTFSSTSLGTSADGTLRHPASLPFDGEGYAVPTPWRNRHANYGTEALVDLVARASRAVERDAPGGVAAVGDLSRRSGGGSAQHKSHQDGRDVDVFFYATDTGGRPARLTEAMLHFSSDGRALRWSPPQGVRPPPRAVPSYRFDARRNWAFVRALLTDPQAEVQWIFVQRSLGAALLRQAAAEGDDPALLARAAFILHQPSDSEPHDDHMHIRLYCGLGDRRFGCSDKGPVRWWKKMWKYMEAPFGRAPVDSIGADRLAAFGRLIREEPPPSPAAGKLTS